MARPKRPFSGMDTINPIEAKWMVDEAMVPIGSRRRMRWDASTHWFYADPNGQYDPLTLLFVLDAVMNIDPDIELRATALAAWLNNEKNSLTWDPVTVGKCLADLCEGMEDVLGVKCGLLEWARDWRNVFYRIHRNPDTARVAQRLREDLYVLAEEALAARRARKAVSRMVTPLLECPSLRGEWQGVE